MKIAQIAPIENDIPPKKYGGSERIIHTLTEELVKMGHEVTLFATATSKTSANLVSVCPKPIRGMKMKTLYGPNYYTMHNIGLAYSMQSEFDVIHDHNFQIGLPTAQLAQTPVVITLHNAFDEDRIPIFETLSKPFLVTISHAQAKVAPHLNYIGAVYHGISGIEKFPFSSTHKGYLLFVGRIHQEKGVQYAIKTAQILNLPLIIAAKLDAVDRPYFNKFVKPHLSKTIRWIGEVDEKKRNKLMSEALCVLHPVTWPEPFGLTIVESMGCGAPVIGFNTGSIPELIKDGKTGYVVRDVSAMVSGVKKINKIDRTYCHEYAVNNFSSRKMAESYLKIYEKVINLRKKISPPTPAWMELRKKYYSEDYLNQMELKLSEERNLKVNKVSAKQVNLT